MNLLFTCAGRRNYLLEYFKALDGVGVIACDADIHAPALYIADNWFIAPVVSDEEYIPFLLKEAIERNVNAVISLNDVELPVLAEHKNKFEDEGIKVIVSSKEVIDICFDKFKTVSFT